MYTYMYGWEFNITNYESRNEAAKFRCCTHILHFCPANYPLVEPLPKQTIASYYVGKGVALLVDYHIRR